MAQCLARWLSVWLDGSVFGSIAQVGITSGVLPLLLPFV